MSWRTVVINSHSKLEYKLGYLVVRSEEVRKVHMSEISTVIVESVAVSLTTSLLCELIKNKINIVFCDEKHNPYSQLLPLNGSHDASKKLKLQHSWNEDIRKEVWTEIVKNKIIQQSKFLKELELSQSKLLDEYTREITIGDETNREGHSAKVYFNALFGLSFSREWNTFINSALNYGYAILLSIFNRTIVANGYNTQIGLFHRSEYNPHNFACDLMEPFRILVDRLVCTMEGKELQIEHKRILQDIINQKVKIKNKLYTVNDAVYIYCKSVFDALNNDNIELLEFYEL